jgi:hypothetical protein
MFEIKSVPAPDAPVTVSPIVFDLAREQKMGVDVLRFAPPDTLCAFA